MNKADSINEFSLTLQHFVTNPRIYNLRPCPVCGKEMFGMPGGHDAHCSECGYKDPCCGD